MALLKQILNDLTTAMKSRDAARLTVLRSIKSSVIEKEISTRTEGKSVELTDEQVVQVLMKAAKQRKDSITQFETAGRKDLADSESYELSVIEEYLPKMMDETEIRALVSAAIAKTGAKGPADMGKVMGMLMPQVKGKADGSLVNKIVKDSLSG